MQHISYALSSDHIQSAESYFPADYIAVIRKKNTYEQSLVGRYMVNRIVEQYWGIKGFFPQVDINGKPVQEGGIFWNISHSGEHVFVGASSRPIGVDIEVIRPRDSSLFETFSEQEWNILGEKNWDSFYILWSAKEALVKKYLGGIDGIGKWQLISIEYISDSIRKLSFSDENVVEIVNSEVRDGVVKSICG